MVQTKKSISKFSQKLPYAVHFSVFSEKTAWFKPSTLFLNFFKNDIRLLSSQFSLKQQYGSNKIAFL